MLLVQNFQDAYYWIQIFFFFFWYIQTLWREICFQETIFCIHCFTSMTEHYSTSKDFHRSVKNDVPLYIIIQKTDTSSFIILFEVRVYYCILRKKWIFGFMRIAAKITFYEINYIIYINIQQNKECRLFKNCKFL